MNVFIDDRTHMHRVNTEYMWQMRTRVVHVTFDTPLERQIRLEPLDRLSSPSGRVGGRLAVAVLVEFPEF